MSSNSAIEWTDATWNPIVGCAIVSPGCTNCYAMRMAHRIEAIADHKPSGQGGHYVGTTKVVNGHAVWTGNVAQAPARTLTAPLRWQKPRRIFVNSMGDLFHESIHDEWIDRVFAVMALSPQHTFQVLTKRAERMRDYMTRHNVGARWGMEARGHMVSVASETAVDWARKGLPNVWLGVSAEDQANADERIPLLLQTPAAVRFVSCEPLLGPLALAYLRHGERCFDALNGTVRTGDAEKRTSNVVDGNKLDWVIAGGESGPKARPMHPDWARLLRDQCKVAGVPFFFKQWGAWHPNDHAIRGDSGHTKVGKKAAGRLLDGVQHNAIPEIMA